MSNPNPEIPAAFDPEGFARQRLSVRDAAVTYLLNGGDRGSADAGKWEFAQADYLRQRAQRPDSNLDSIDWLKGK